MHIFDVGDVCNIQEISEIDFLDNLDRFTNKMIFERNEDTGMLLKNESGNLIRKYF
jgi:hypothetical protein